MRKSTWMMALSICAAVAMAEAADLTGDLGLSGRATTAARNLRPRGVGGGAGGGAAGRASGSAANDRGVRARGELRTRAGANVDSRGVGLGVGAGIQAESNAQVGRHSEGQDPSTTPRNGGDANTNPNRGSRSGIVHANLILRHRLAEIDHMRDLALEYGDEALLQRADQFEHRVRAEHQLRLQSVTQESATQVGAAADYGGYAEGAANAPYQQRVQGRLEAYGQQAFEARPNAPQAPSYDGHPEAQGQAWGRLEFADRPGNAAQGEFENRANGGYRPNVNRPAPTFRPNVEGYGNAYGEAYGGFGHGPAPGQFPSAAQGATGFESRGRAIGQYGARSAARLENQSDARNRVAPAGSEVSGQGAYFADQTIDAQTQHGGANRVNQAALEQRGTATGNFRFQGPRGIDARSGAQAAQEFYYGPPRQSPEPAPQSPGPAGQPSQGSQAAPPSATP